MVTTNYNFNNNIKGGAKVRRVKRRGADISKPAVINKDDFIDIRDEIYNCWKCNDRLAVKNSKELYEGFNCAVCGSWNRDKNIKKSMKFDILEDTEHQKEPAIAVT